MALKVDGVKIDNKTSVTRIPKLSRDLRRRLLDEGLLTFGVMKKRCRSNVEGFKSLLDKLEATPQEVGFLISLIRQGQTVPPRTPSPQRTSA